MSFTMIGTPTAFANDNKDGGTAWTNVSNAADTTGNGAQCTLAAGADSQWLVCTACNEFAAMPLGATLVGTEMTFEMKASLLSMINMVSGNPVIGGVITAINGILTPILGLLGFVSSSVGGPSTIIGTTTTVQAMDSGFGFAFRAQNVGILSATINFRDVRIALTYEQYVTQGMMAGGVIS